MNGKTIADKIWENHAIVKGEDGRHLLYIDRHLTHEVTSPVAFEGLRIRGLRVRRPDLTIAFMDHDVPTGEKTLPIHDELSAAQMNELVKNAKESGIFLFDYYSPYQGIAHVVGPELGITLPGITIACGDSHTSTHGAMGALVFGIGTSQVEQVFATQTLWLKKPMNMEVRFEGNLPYGVTAKDVILAMIGRIGTGGGIGHIIEYRGNAVEDMSIEERMTICNMATEAGARTAIVAPDEKTFEYVREKPFAPPEELWDEAVSHWKTLSTDPSAKYDKTFSMDISKLEPQVTWGTNPAMVTGVSETIPHPEDFKEPSERKAVERALKYMGLTPGMKVTDINIDRVFIGSCTNGRLSDLIAAARVVKGKKVNPHMRAMVVPGSQLVKRSAERLGLHRIFIEAGFEWRNSGCSMCIGMNEDRLSPGERAASTSNRNFENRQGPRGRTHLVSPIMAAAAAIAGHFVDVREWELNTPLE